MYIDGIKCILNDHSCDEEYLEEFDKENFYKTTFLIDVLPRNRLDPNCICDKDRFFILF